MAGVVGLRVALVWALVWGLVWGLIGVGIAVGQTGQPISLVQPKGTGRIIYRPDPAWKVSRFGVYDDGTRPALQMRNMDVKMSVSYLMYRNDTGKHDSESCRKALVSAVVGGAELISTVKNKREGTYTTRSGKVLMTHSHLVVEMADAKLNQQNLFGFYGDTSTCFEVHVSKISFEPGDERLLESELDRFEFEARYQPTMMDYFQQAEILFRARKDPGAAAYYYRAALDALPPDAGDAQVVMQRRILTDELVMSYGMTGDFKKSRALATEAIARDPEYPLNYYNLACADAEQGHAAEAKTHLQQAFERKANMLPGETMPDPTRDESFLKLKKDKAFWEFAQGFSTPMELKRR